MSYAIKNNSELSRLLARAIKDELIQEGHPEELAEIVVNNYDLENRGLGRMMSEIISTCHRVLGE